MNAEGRKHNGASKARLDVQTAREVTPFAAEILRNEHGTEHNPGVRDDLCPLCIAEKHGAQPDDRPGQGV